MSLQSELQLVTNSPLTDCVLSSVVGNTKKVTPQFLSVRIEPVFADSENNYSVSTAHYRRTWALDV